MPTQLLSPGQPVSLLPTVSYALPNRAVYVQSSAAVEVSLDNSTFVALAGTTTGSVLTAASFIRAVSTTQPATVSLKFV